LVSVRERQAGRTGVANGLLDALARLVPAEPRFLRWYHTTLARGNARRIAIARALRDREPQSYLAQGNLALALTADADEAERTKAMQEALRLGSDRAFTHWVAGQVATGARRFDEAIAHHDKALTLNPLYVRSVGARAANSLYAGRPADARRDFRQLEERTINTIDVAFARRAEALTYLHEGNQDETVKQLTRVVEVFERENTKGSVWRNQLSLAHQHLSVLAGVRKDVAAIERATAAQKKIYTEFDPAAMLFWSAVSMSLAGQPARARADLTSYEKLIASRDIAPAPSLVAAVTSMVLVAERKYEEAVRAAGDSSDFTALLAKYQALMALGRTQDAREPLQRLHTASGYAADNVIVPLARVLYGRK
jgi:tetratricopeptide (TPR) repeat protein